MSIFENTLSMVDGGRTYRIPRGNGTQVPIARLAAFWRRGPHDPPFRTGSAKWRRRRFALCLVALSREHITEAERVSRFVILTLQYVLRAPVVEAEDLVIHI